MTRNIKDWMQYTTAIVLVLSGAVLSYLSFFLSGDVQGGVLTYLGIGTTFAGAVFGLAVYTREKFEEIKDYVDERLNKKK